MPPPLKTISRVITALSTTASELKPRVSPQPSRGKTLPPRQAKQISGPLAALKHGTSSGLMRPDIAAPTARREVGVSALLRAQSLPSSSATRTAQHARSSTSASHPSPSLPAPTHAGPRSNSDLRQALKQHFADTPGRAHEQAPSTPPKEAPVDPFAASQAAQMRIQIAMKKADVLKAFGDAMKEATKN